MAKTPTSDGPWLSRAFLALSDPLRREIIEEIIVNPSISVSDICAKYPVSRFTIMRHLNILEETLARDSMRGGSGEDGNNKTSCLETFPLKSVTDNAAAMFKDEAIAKGLKFKYSSIDTKVTSEPLQLMRALSNLLSNAIKHTHQGHVTIACATDTNHAKITISNSGAVMSDTDIQRYLMPFEKGKQSKGTGLGLYQVKQICGALGHKFELLSTENAGTQAIIKISLPS